MDQYGFRPYIKLPSNSNQKNFDIETHLHLPDGSFYLGHCWKLHRTSEQKFKHGGEREMHFEPKLVNIIFFCDTLLFQKAFVTR